MQATFAFLLVAGVVCGGRKTETNGQTSHQWVFVSSPMMETPAALEDLDDDGRVDLAAEGRWFLTRGEGSFEETEAIFTVPATGVALLQDTDGDGSIDRISFAGAPFPPPR